MKTKRFKWLVATLMLVAAMVMPSVAWAQITPTQPSVGDGSEKNPYQISSADELYWFADLVNGKLEDVTQNASANAELTANIEVNPGVLTSDGSLNGTPSIHWPKIMEYNGTFDGKGHTISGLFFYTNAHDEEYFGLFATTLSNAEILNLGIVDSYFHGGRMVGGVCGWNTGTIKNCYNKSTVSGISYLGGVCGWNDGTIENCFNTGKITDGDAIGGVCGINNNGTITNCYNTGTISGVSAVGGVYGINNGTITNCYYLSGTATDGISDNSGTGSAEVKTTDDFASGEVCYLLNGMKSEGTGGNPLAWYQNINGYTYPVLDSRYGKVYRGYKCLELTYSNNPDELSESPVHRYDNGICKACKAYQPATLTTDKYDINGDNTNDNVYEIGNAGQLYWFAGLVNGDASVCDFNADSNPTGTKQNKAACAVLTANIVVNRGLTEGKTMLESLKYDASGNVTNGSNFVAWTPIGFNYENYTGTFDGKGHTVSGLYFNNTSTERVGLFGCVDSGGKISNVGVLDSYFQFNMFGGGVCGRNSGEINNCHSFSTVINTNGYGGGVCGYNYGGKILNSYNNGIVSGKSNTGGVCGYNDDNGEITNCHNCGTISGTGFGNTIAGVCGYNDSNCTISGCYNTGAVSGQNSGGVCFDNYGIVKNCYNTGTVSGQTVWGGVCGSNNSGTVMSCYNSGVVNETPGEVGGICGFVGSKSSTINCYYDSNNYSGDAIDENQGGTVDNVMGKTTAQFNSGEVAWLLNGSTSAGNSLAWYQNIDNGATDAYPLLDSNGHGKVYQCTPCTGVYSNAENKAGDHLFGENDNGFCHNCGVYQPATLTTDKYDINGDKTKDNVYEIGNAGQLYWFAGLVNGDKSVCDYDANSNQNGTQQNLAACAVLTANIVVNKNVLKADGSIADDVSGFRSWTPIGNSENYKGTFDGKRHTVSGLYFNDTSEEKVGLFGYLGIGGKISNVGVLDSYFQFKKFGGGVCGWNFGEINNCHSFSTVINTNGYGGGVCGYNYGGKILNSYNNGIVSGNINIGGVCGYNNDNGEITNCHNSGTISGTGDYNNTAGVCGYNDKNCTISGCYNTGAVSGQNSGGVCYDNYGTIKNCYNTGTVSGQYVYGGVCGTNKATVTSCYNSGAMNGTGGKSGSICGDIYVNSSITNCYYDSDIYSENAIGDNKNGTVGEDVMDKTTEQFASGEVCYLLNGSSPYGEWGQQIYTNGYPVLGSAYKVLRAARDGENGTNYWATFSNRDSNAELTAPTGNVTVYNATVSSGTLTLTERSDDRVAKEEGVLLKAGCEYLNAKNISDEVSAAAAGENHLVATPAKAETVTADDNYTLYRLTYNDVNQKKGLGFYLSLIKDANGVVESSVGKQLAATPGKAYLKVATVDVTKPSSAAIRGFVFPGDGETTGIECISVTDDSMHRNGNSEGIFDLQGRKVSKPTKGVYIKNNKLFLK